MREKPSAWSAKSVYTSPSPSATADATSVSFELRFRGPAGPHHLEEEPVAGAGGTWRTFATAAGASAAALRHSSGSTPTRRAVSSVMSVTMKPGAIALTLMPNGPSSMASVRVKPCSPIFAAE